MKKIRNILLLSIVLIGMVCALVLFFTINKQPLVSVDTKGKTMPTPMEVENVRSIGQWEFLTLTDERLPTRCVIISLATMSFHASIMARCALALT